MLTRGAGPEAQDNTTPLLVGRMWYFKAGFIDNGEGVNIVERRETRLWQDLGDIFLKPRYFGCVCPSKPCPL